MFYRMSQTAWIVIPIEATPYCLIIRHNVAFSLCVGEANFMYMEYTTLYIVTLFTVAGVQRYIGCVRKLFSWEKFEANLMNIESSAWYIVSLF